ncbi:2OG-Fe(II) oxygenase [Roseomonas fluvialis]|uniref:2-oxoglutarate-dependent ethylene/succinate-forming enzyme n=2 Tax=Roseomonas fluvialis TaxID=1750527 RepID=A0ABN6P7I1_9PROT|nr:2OG-Fe(II) oxygenase [Roseomonas fluvialis]
MSDMTSITAPAAPALSRWANANEIPVIDFAPLSSGNAEAAERVAREVRDACEQIGFFTIVNHPVPAPLIRNIFRQAERFFALPEEAKMQVWMGRSNTFRGFLPMDQGASGTGTKGKAVAGFQNHLAEETLKARKPNRNEVFQIAAELPADDPDLLAGKPLHGRNLWPDGLPGFREDVLGYYDAMRDFAALLASVFARGLDLSPDYFAQFYRKPLIQLRLLHYLPHADDQAAMEGGASRAHCDAGGFTMLQQDQTGGLEVQSRSGEWIVVPPVENAFVVNIGDSMKMWTNHRFASTLHRVVNRYGKERFSIGVFANPDYDTVISPLPTCVDAANPPRFDSMVAGDALLYLYSRVWPSSAAAA